MKRASKTLLIAAVAVTGIALGVWVATERHTLTKFKVVEEARVPVGADDPFAGTGFYDDEVRTETLVKDEFHLGLLPSGKLDRNALSVASLSGPPWALAAGLILWRRRRRKRSDAGSESKQ